MRNTAILSVLVVGLGAWACSESSPDRSLSRSSVVLANADDGGADPNSDPMEHINYLATDALKGRNSPSPDFDTAANYVTERLSTYGLVGPNPGDVNGAYAQSFTQGSFAPQSASLHDEASPHALGAHEFGSELFERNFFVDEQMDPAAFRIIEKQYQRALRARGLSPAALTPGDPRSVSAIQSAAAAAGENSHNVLGKLEGTGEKKNEVIVVMAHLDHIGVNSSGAVYNGADDNASGSAVILSSLPALSKAKANGELNRSILFIWTAAEEDGLVGSKYFVDHPIAGIDLSDIVGVVNMDMVGRWDAQRISVIDSKSDGTTSYLASLLTQANASLSDPFDSIHHDIDSYARRQDGASFYDKNEDVIFLFEGLSNPAGGGDLNADYHRTTDDVAKIIADNNGDKPRKMRDLLVELVKLAANR